MQITAQPRVAFALANLPKDCVARLVNTGFEWTADKAGRILAEWTKRYNPRSEKRRVPRLAATK